MDKKLIQEFDKRQKKQKRSREAVHSFDGKSKQPKIVEDETLKPNINFRDRAQERREGINRDFELDPDDLQIANPTYDTALGDGEEVIDEDELRRRQIEESKYLGGDVEHTHLVKGLDFALLEKVKKNQELAAELKSKSKSNLHQIPGDPDSDSEDEEFRSEVLLAATTAANSKRATADLDKLRKEIPCRTALARRILNVLEEKWPDKSELFKPGRMSYIVSLDPDSDEHVTTILRSKADASAADDTKLPDEAEFTTKQLVSILSKIREGQSNSELNRKHKSFCMNDDII